MSFETPNPFLYQLREGSLADPYVDKVETLKPVDGRIVLSELPVKQNGVVVDSHIEVDSNTPTGIQFYVDYTYGVVYFVSTKNTTVTVRYKGRGLISLPSDRVFYKNDEVYKSIDAHLEDMSLLIESYRLQLSAMQNQVNNLVVDGDSSPEAAQARVGIDGINHKTLKDRIDTEMLSKATGSPKGTYATLSALQAAKPSGDNSIYLVTANGNWYYWSGTAWTSGGVYQSTGLDATTQKEINNVPEISKYLIGEANTDAFKSETLIRITDWIKENATLTDAGTDLAIGSSNSNYYSGIYIEATKIRFKITNATQTPIIMIGAGTSSFTAIGVQSGIQRRLLEIPKTAASGAYTTILSTDAALTGSQLNDEVTVAFEGNFVVVAIKRAAGTKFDELFRVDLTLYPQLTGWQTKPVLGFIKAVSTSSKVGSSVYKVNNFGLFQIGSDVSQAILNLDDKINVLQGEFDDYPLLTDIQQLQNKVNEIDLTAEQLSNDFYAYVESGGTVAPSNNTVDLVMFMGQSNMVGRGTASEAPIVPTGWGYEFKAITAPVSLSPLVEPFGLGQNNPSGISDTTRRGSMVSSFVNAYYPLVKVPIVGVSASKSGTTSAEWQPGGTLLPDAISRFNTAKDWLIANGYTIRRKYMVWCQGESDGDNIVSKETYIANFENIFAAMKAQGIERCYLVRIGNHRDNPTKYNLIMQAQTEMCQTHEDIILVSTKFDKMATDGLMQDAFHYTQQGYNIVGNEAGINTAQHINTAKEPTIYDWENNTLYFTKKI